MVSTEATSRLGARSTCVCVCLALRLLSDPESQEQEHWLVGRQLIANQAGLEPGGFISRSTVGLMTIEKKRLIDRLAAGSFPDGFELEGNPMANGGACPWLGANDSHVLFA